MTFSNMASEELIADLLSLIYKRGLPALYRDNNGYLRVIDEDTLSKVSSSLGPNIDNVNNSVRELISQLMNIRVFVSNDINIDFSDFTGTVEDESKITDLNMSTYGVLKANDNDRMIITLNNPIRTSKIFIGQMNVPLCKAIILSEPIPIKPIPNPEIEIGIHYVGEPMIYQVVQSTCRYPLTAPFIMHIINTDDKKLIDRIEIRFIGNQEFDMSFIGLKNSENISIEEDNVGLAKDNTLKSVIDLLKEYEIHELTDLIKDHSNNDNLLIEDTTKPSSPQISDVITFPANDSNGTTLYGANAVIQIKQFAGQVILNASNSDSNNAHTLNYEIDVDGVAYTGSISVAAGGTASKTIDIKQTNPSDNTLNIDIYLWADTSNVITLDSHEEHVYVGTNNTSEEEVISINQDGKEMVNANFGGSASYTFVLRSQYSNDIFTSNTNAILNIEQLIPKSKINLISGTAGTYVYVEGVSVIKKSV